MTERYISGEEHEAMQRQAGRPQAGRNGVQPLWWAGGVAVLIVATFLGTAAYFNHKNSTPDSSQSAGPSGGSLQGPTGAVGGPHGSGPNDANGPGGPAAAQNTVTGTVTAASDTSITVQPSSGSAKTFSVTSSVQMLAGPSQSAATYTAGSLHIGDKIGVIPDSSNLSQAHVILLSSALAN